MLDLVSDFFSEQTDEDLFCKNFRGYRFITLTNCIVAKCIVFFFRQLLCGNHMCREVCHVGPCNTCALLPSVVTKCPCTQTKLEDLRNDDGSPVVRKECTDPIPTCGKVREISRVIRVDALVS